MPGARAPLPGENVELYTYTFAPLVGGAGRL